MNKGAVALITILILLIPLAYPISIKDLISRYIFSTATAQMDVTNYIDFMIDKDNNGLNDTLVFELTTSNSNGNFIFIINLLDKNGILTNETNKTLNLGVNKLNITFSSILLTQNQFNYSIKVYNSTYSLKYRKDNILTQNYSNYEEGFKIINLNDFRDDKSLKINITLNSSINGTFETILFLTYNDSIISIKENKSIISSAQGLIFIFDNETIKRTHHIGSFNISSLKIGKKIIKINSATPSYDFRDFAAASYISDFTDNGIDTNSNSKYNLLEISAKIQIVNYNPYAIVLGLYDLVGNPIETKNVTSYLSTGNNVVHFGINGSRIHEKKLNGPFIVKYIKLFEDGSLIDQINDAYTTQNYNFNDFDGQNLPDLSVDISASDDYHYGINNITINFTFRNIGNKHAFNVFTDIFDNNTLNKVNKTNFLNAGSHIRYQFNFVNISDFEISAIADLQNFVEESDEGNNAERLLIKLNKRPKLESINNITVNELEKVTVNISATDTNHDDLVFSINSSKFSSQGNVFVWNTTANDSGEYTLSAVVSDGYLNDSVLFKITIVDILQNDMDNDGINDSIDALIGNKDSVNTSTINLSILIGNSSNLSRFFNESFNVKFLDGNLPRVEFYYDFSRNRLNLTNVTIDKQLPNQPGSLFVRGLKVPDGTKILYIDNINKSFKKVCIKDTEISAISEISAKCSAKNEIKISCNGKLIKKNYKCAYNSTTNEYQILGLRHSGVVQIK